MDDGAAELALGRLMDHLRMKIRAGVASVLFTEHKAALEKDHARQQVQHKKDKTPVFHWHKCIFLYAATALWLPDIANSPYIDKLSLILT